VSPPPAARRLQERAGYPHSNERAKQVILLDRDGTIVIDREYLSDPAGLEFLPHAAEGLQRLRALGHRLVIISNQSGVGRGFLTLDQLQTINDRLSKMMQEIGAPLAGIYCCPHRPDENCDCRKPRTRLVEQAASELQFDPRQAIVIGDKASDVELGQRLGARTILIASRTPDSRTATPPAMPFPPDYTAPDLLAAALLIEQLDASPTPAG
jgi:histidinol-phosphate phosphatase family protein